MANNDMPSIIEFSEDIATAEAPEPLPSGDYAATIKHAEIRMSERSGNKYLSLQCHIPADQYPADYVDGNPDGTTLAYNRLVMEDTPAARYRLKKAMEALGLQPTRSVDVTSFIGLGCIVTTKIEKYEGEARANIAAIKGTE